MGTDSTDTYFLVDDIHPAKAGGEPGTLSAIPSPTPVGKAQESRPRPTLFSVCPNSHLHWWELPLSPSLVTLSPHL